MPFARRDTIDARLLARERAVRHALVLLPICVTLVLFVRYYAAHELAVDFHFDFWVAGERVRHLLSPYRWDRRQIAGTPSRSFPYPALTALLFVPFSLVPHAVIDVAFALLCVAAPLATLRLLRVRDWRVYSAALLWWPVINGWQTANLTLLLGLGVAGVWRSRDSPLRTGLLTALLISVKPVVWPLALWLVLTRRLRACGYAALAALVLGAIAWPVLGVGQLSAWWHLLGVQMDVLYARGYGLTALATSLGTDRAVGTGLEVLVSALLVGACAQLARHRREREAFALGVALMIASSPLVDNHYFALLIVPLAIMRPRLSPAWLVPLLYWLCPATGVSSWQIMLAWAITGGVLLSLVGPDRLRARLTRIRPRLAPQTAPVPARAPRRGRPAPSRAIQG